MNIEISTNPFFIILFSSGIIFIIAAIISMRYPPKEINMFYGYRTTSSMKNKERWDFAQRYSNREMLKYGIGMCVLGIFSLLVNLTISPWLVFASVVVLIGFVVLLLYRTEKAIKKKFRN